MIQAGEKDSIKSGYKGYRIRETKRNLIRGTGSGIHDRGYRVGGKGFGIQARDTGDDTE